MYQKSSTNSSCLPLTLRNELIITIWLRSLVRTTGVPWPDAQQTLKCRMHLLFRSCLPAWLQASKVVVNRRKLAYNILFNGNGDWLVGVDNIKCSCPRPWMSLLLFQLLLFEDSMVTIRVPLSPHPPSVIALNFYVCHTSERNGLVNNHNSFFCKVAWCLKSSALTLPVHTPLWDSPFATRNSWLQWQLESGYFIVPTWRLVDVHSTL